MQKEDKTSLYIMHALKTDFVRRSISSIRSDISTLVQQVLPWDAIVVERHKAA